MEKPVFHISVVMERAATNSRWQRYQWRVAGVLADVPGAGEAQTARTIARHENSLHRLYGGLVLELHRDEAEGYYLNLTSPDPRVFVLWRTHEDRAGAEDEVEPLFATLSYNEAARWMDAQEKVDSVPIIAELLEPLDEFVALHYKPETKKPRVRPRSFESKEGRYKSGM